jgi:dual specificity protein kinase YAK1
VKAVNIDTKDIVAIKVVKNKPAYFNQGLVEIQILEMVHPSDHRFISYSNS